MQVIVSIAISVIADVLAYIIIRKWLDRDGR